MVRWLGLALPSAALVLVACGPSASSGDCGDSIGAGDLVITEVFADAKAPPGGSGTDEGKEWFEVYNASDRPLELKGLTIVHGRPDGSRAKSHTMTAVTIAPGQYFTLGNSATDLLPAYIDYGYSADLGDMFNTDGGQLTLQCGSSEIDGAIYEAVEEGRSRQLTAAQPPDYTVNDDQLNWCEAADSEFEAANFGTPGSESDCTPIVIGQCDDNGVMRDAVPAMPGDLVITEVMPNPATVSDTLGEWFEVHAINAVDLNGLGLDRAGDSANPNVLEAPGCLRVPAGGYAVFARSIDTSMNGGLPPLAVKGRFSFSLVDGTTAAPGDVRILSGTNVIDAVTWTDTNEGRAHALDPAAYDAAENDVESAFCDAADADAYGSASNFGTPGTVNPSCPVGPVPGTCDDGGTARAVVTPAVGELVITEFLANPATVTGFTDAQREWFEIYNASSVAFDLNDLTLASASSMTQIISTSCKSVPPGGYALFARSNDPSVNAMLPEVDATFTFSIVDTGSPARLEVRDGVNVIDAITYTSGINSGLSEALDPDFRSDTGNDSHPTNWCNGAGAYGDASNMGTPKAANPPCP